MVFISALGTVPQDGALVTALIVIGTFLVLGIFHFLHSRYLRKMAKDTETHVDDVILKKTATPAYALILVTGAYLTILYLSLELPFIRFIDEGFFILATFFVALLLSRAAKVLISRWIETRHRYEQTPQLLSKVVSIIIYILATLVVMQRFNIKITPIIATLGLGGLAVGLALKDTLSNFFAGMHIISDRPIEVGDFIELESGEQGVVQDIGWRSTRIETVDNNYVVVPNAQLAGSIITNTAVPQAALSIRVEAGVAYGTDLDRAEEVALEVAREVQEENEGAVEDFEPTLRFKEFGESNVLFFTTLRLKSRKDKWDVIHDFIKRLKARFDEEGIAIEWPVRKIYHGNSPPE